MGVALIHFALVVMPVRTLDSVFTRAGRALRARGNSSTPGPVSALVAEPDREGCLRAAARPAVFSPHSNP